ncbi:MAG TPA: hypothetical protein VE783_04780 [Candidatus Limnocylindrales bacterium]|nr:hypothetical protein [Candidatus Limnocylindrales bacterium]
MRNVFAALQVFAALFATLLGLAMILKSTLNGVEFVGAFLAAIGLTFLILLGINLKK